MHSDFGIVHSATSQLALDALLDSRSASLVVVNFYAEGNEPCQVIASFLSTASKQFERVTFVQVNMTEVQDLANKYGVVVAPTCVFFKNKIVLESLNGAEQTTLQALLDKHAPREIEDGSPTHFSLSRGLLQSIWHPEAFQNVDPTCLPPTHLFNDILGQLMVTLNPSTQSRAAKSTSEKPIFEPTLTLYCPVEGGEYIIDATVKVLAHRTGSQVQVIDVAQLAADQCGTYWIDSFPALESTGVSVPENMSARERLEDLIEQILNSSQPEPDAACASGPRPRLVYVRDFRFLANSAPSFYSALLAIVHKQLRQHLESNNSIPTAIILGVSATLDESSPRVKSELIHENWGYGIHSELPSRWDEGDDAQSRRESRMGDQQQSWNSGELLGNMYYSLARTNVFPGVASYDYKSSFKYSRIGVVVPEKRNLEQERHGREKRRLEINKFYAQMALYVSGGELSTGPPSSQEGLDDFTLLCRNKLISLDLLRCLADQAVGAVTIASHSSKLDKLCETLSSRSRVGVTWDDLKLTWQTQTKMEEERSNWLESSMKPTKEAEPEPESAPEAAEQDASGPEQDNNPTEPQQESKPKDEDDTETSSEDSDQDEKDKDHDEVVERVKRQSLNSYESTMLSHIVKPSQIQTGFDSVHLPAETIQLIRNLVSLPLICPEAFQTGILKQYNMTGALLFGPPGTGKTHLARAIAKESGSRMIIIKPSDIHDKYVGESEKLIDGLFKLARKLKPCIIFIDEIDALLGARTNQHATNSSRYHTSTLTQFMQEMDGMVVSDVVVIGATNRPFDLDDAVVRRLPCRVLVDLPDTAAREAILRILLKDEQLDEEIDIPALAMQSERFSGSDLKNLCVMAAYESVKESAHGKLPWNIQQPSKLDEDSTPAITELPDTATSEPQVSKETDEAPGTCQNSGPDDSGAPVTSTEASAGVDSQKAEKEAIPVESIQARSIFTRHFSRALLHVRASASDSQMSVRELHRWNRQFGSGGR